MITIKVNNLIKKFGDFNALKGISFEIQKGKVVGFVGENGAGKTTAMRILATLEEPTHGEVIINGTNIFNNPTKIRKTLGWMPDDFGTYQDMSVFEYIDFFARAYGYKGNQRINRVKDIMEFTDLSQISKKMINKISKGMGQRLCLGRTLINDPEVLIMDEPAAGLDPQARIDLKNLIRILAQEGKTILISSHILTELSEMCDSILFISKGELIHHGESELLKRKDKSNTIISVELLKNPIENGVSKLEKWVQMQPDVNLIDLTKKGGRLTIDENNNLNYKELTAEILKRMIKDKLEIISFNRDERKLEDAFIDIINERN